MADFLAGVAYWEKQGKELKTETITPSEDSKLKVGSDAVILTRNYTDNWGSFAFQLRDYVSISWIDNEGGGGCWIRTIKCT